MLLVMLGTIEFRRRAAAPAASPEVATFDVDLGGLAPQRGGNTGGLVEISVDGRCIAGVGRTRVAQRRSGNPPSNSATDTLTAPTIQERRTIDQGAASKQVWGGNPNACQHLS